MVTRQTSRPLMLAALAMAALALPQELPYTDVQYQRGGNNRKGTPDRATLKNRSKKKAAKASQRKNRDK